MTLVYILIASSFILNLIITISLRFSEKRKKSMKLINNALSSFRNEVSSTIARISTNSQDAEQRLDLKMQETKSVMEDVLKTLDLLMVHQKDLSELWAICQNYSQALQALKVQTEQAEARINAVEQKIRDAKEFSSYVDSFHNESEAIKNQLTEAKQNYILLVTDTETRLLSSAKAQKDQNEKELALFSVNLERFKTNFLDFVRDEKDRFNELTTTFSENALKNNEKLNEYASEIKADVEESRAELEEFRNALEKDLVSLEEKREELIKSAENIEETTINNLKNASSLTEDILEKQLKDKEEEIAASLESFSLSLEENENSVESAIENLYLKRERAEEKIEESLKEGERKLEILLTELDTEEKEYTAKCKNDLEEALIALKEKGEESLESFRGTEELIIKTFLSEIEECNQVVKRIQGFSREKVEETIEELDSLKKKIEDGHQEIYTLSDVITGKKEEIWELEQESKKIKEENDTLLDSLKTLREDIAEFKERRLEAEKAYIKAKAQNDEINKNETKESGIKEKKNKYEDLIEDFPDDLLISSKKESDEE